MLFFGSTEEARNYSCRISIQNKFGNEFIYSGPVHTLDKTEKAIVDSGFLLMIESSAAKQMVDKESNLKIEVTTELFRTGKVKLFPRSQKISTNQNQSQITV